MAPELVNKFEQYSKPVDLWNVGIIMYELLCNKHPLVFIGEDKSEYLKRLKKN